MDWFTMNPRVMRNIGDMEVLSSSEPVNVPRHTALTFRAIEPDDVEMIVELHRRSSAKTIFSRYHSPRLPTRQEIAQICHLADEGNGRAIVVTTGSTRAEVVALAYYIASGANAAEVALLVEDRYQGQGIGGRLLEQLTELAIRQGICFFEAYVLPTNKPMLHLLHKTGMVVQNRLDYGAREIQLQLTAVTPLESAFVHANLAPLRHNEDRVAALF